MTRPRQPSCAEHPASVAAMTRRGRVDAIAGRGGSPGQDRRARRAARGRRDGRGGALRPSSPSTRAEAKDDRFHDDPEYPDGFRHRTGDGGHRPAAQGRHPGSLGRSATTTGSRSQTVWGLGPVLVAACGISTGQRVLDVAAGTGNTAIRAAEAGAQVVASDLTPEHFPAGRRDANAHGLELEWVEADAERLPFDDREFDVVTSSFGAMFAPAIRRWPMNCCAFADPEARSGCSTSRPRAWQPTSSGPRPLRATTTAGRAAPAPVG